MKIVNILLIAIVAMLSFIAGMAKVLQAPQELDFLLGVGLSVIQVVVFGALQIVGGGLIAFVKTRIVGSLIVISTLLLSTILIFISGNIPFGLVSILPIILASIIFQQTLSLPDNKVANE